MPPQLNYANLLLVAVSALLLVLFLLFWRRRDLARVSPLQNAINNSSDEVSQELVDLLLPFLILEERFPAFGEILALVISRQGIRDLAGRAVFTEPAEFLAKAAFEDGHESLISGALCHMVRGFLDDPDIEYGCRPQLPGLVDRFIDEVDRAAAAVS